MQWRTDLKHAEGAVKDLAEAIRDGVRKEMVQCEEYVDIEKQKIFTRRCDTGEIVAFRPASEDDIEEAEQEAALENQGDLFGAGDDAGDDLSAEEAEALANGFDPGEGEPNPEESTG